MRHLRLTLSRFLSRHGDLRAGRRLIRVRPGSADAAGRRVSGVGDNANVPHRRGLIRKVAIVIRQAGELVTLRAGL